MGLFSKKDKLIKCRFSHQEGVSGVGNGTIIDMALNDQEKTVIITVPLSNKNPVTIEYKKIKNISFYSEKEMTEKKKSVIGRAIVGGALMGGVGAVVGGMSGIGDKKKEETMCYIEIEYIGETHDESKTILVKIVGSSIGWSKFFESLKAKCE